MRLEAYAKKWRITYNPHKTHHLLLLYDGVYNFDLRMLNVNLQKTTQAPYLGIVLDKRMNLKEHAKTVINKARSKFNMMKNLFESPFLLKPIKLKLFRTFILPIVTYGFTSYENMLSTEARRKITSFERKFTKRALNLPLWTTTRQLQEKHGVNFILS